MIAHPIQPDLQSAVSSVYDDDNFLAIGLDGDAAHVNLQPAEALHPLGFAARPMDPDTDPEGNAVNGAACTVLRLAEGNQDSAIVLSDARCTPALPLLPKGSSIAYAPNKTDDPPRTIWNADGTILVHVPSTGKVTIEVEGGPQIIVDNGFVQLGVAGGTPVVLDNGLTAYLSAVSSALAAAGHPVGPPPTIAATKVKGI